MSSNQFIYTTKDLDQQRIIQQQQQQQQHNILAAQAKLKEPKTSTSHPINISWIIPTDVLEYLSVADLPNDIDLLDLLVNPFVKERVLNFTPEQQRQLEQPSHKVRGNLCLSSCPGKKVRLSGPVRGRATINRDLNLDFARMKSFGITMLVCCLDDNELNFLGASWPKYEIAAKNHNLEIIRLPMIEGSCPNTFDEIIEAVKRVNIEIAKGDNVLVHCRGGVGRAGLFAACWLLENMLCKSVERAVQVLREQRSPKAIETTEQALYIIKYLRELNSRLGLNSHKDQTLIQQEHIHNFEKTYTGAPSISFIARLENDLNSIVP